MIIPKNIKQLQKQLQTKGKISRKLLIELLRVSISIIENQSNILSVCSPIIVVGDIHGQYYDLLPIFAKFGQPSKQNNKYLFLGDYVDRGMFCIEVMTHLLFMKVRFPQSILLLRGNHESKVITSAFNFKTECESKYDSQIYDMFVRLFNTLPLGCIVDNKYFCVHAGISPAFTQIKEIQKIDRFDQPPLKGPICDILWSDPKDQPTNIWMPNKARNCSYYYSIVIVDNFLKKNNLQMIIRAHEVEMEGYKYYKFSQKDKLLTIFSAPNYCRTYNNQAAVAIINPSQPIQIFRYNSQPYPPILPKYQNIFEWTMPIFLNNINKIFYQIMKIPTNTKLNTPIMQDQISLVDAMIGMHLQRIKQDLKVTNQILSMTIQQFKILKNNDDLERYPFGPKINRVKINKIGEQHDYTEQQQFNQSFK